MEWTIYRRKWETNEGGNYWKQYINQKCKLLKTQTCAKTSNHIPFSATIAHFLMQGKSKDKASNGGKNVMVLMPSSTTGGPRLSGDGCGFQHRDSAAVHCLSDTELPLGQWRHSFGPFCIFPWSQSSGEHLEVGGKGSVLMTRYSFGTTFELDRLASSTSKLIFIVDKKNGGAAHRCFLLSNYYFMVFCPMVPIVWLDDEQSISVQLLTSIIIIQ